MRQPQVGDTVYNKFHGGEGVIVEKHGGYVVDGGSWMSPIYGNINRFNQGYWEVIEYARNKDTRSDGRRRY